METLADVVFLVESSVANEAYINELKTNYIVPTLEHFSQGPIEDREYLISEKHSTQYCVVLYRTAANLLEPTCTAFGPYASPQKIMDLFDRCLLIGGGMESCSNLAEGLATAHLCFDNMQGNRAIYSKDENMLTQKHCILMCNSSSYSMPVMKCYKYAGKTVEELAGLFHERKIIFSIIAPRKIPLNSALISQLSAPPNQNVNPLIQQQQLRMEIINQPHEMQQVQQQQQQNIMNAGMTEPGIQNSQQQQVTSIGGNQPNSSMSNQQNPGPSSDQTVMRDKIWSGILEWVEKRKPDLQKIHHTLQCTVTSNIKDGEPEIKTINWPPKLLMQFIPKNLVCNIGGQFLKDSKMVDFKPQPCEALDALAKNMTTMFAGCVHFTAPPNMPACDIKVLILFYTAEMNTFFGVIPNNQSAFVAQLRKVIHQKLLICQQQQQQPFNQ